MKPLLPEFKPPRSPGRAWWWSLAILIVGMIAAALWTWQRHVLLLDLRARVEAAHANHRATNNLKTAEQPAPVYWQGAQAMLAERSLSWADMLNALEAMDVLGVTPTAVEMAGAGSLSRVEVVFAEHASLLDYVNGLNAGLTGGRGELRWHLQQAHRDANGIGAATITVEIPVVTPPSPQDYLGTSQTVQPGLPSPVAR
jgi:hypothetical protein